MGQTLWAFGDSFTFGHGCRPDSPLRSYYDNYRTENDKIWVDIVGENLKFKTKNLAKCGASNDYIIDTIIDNWHFLKKDDYVVIGITWPHRFDIPLKDKFINITWNWEATPKTISYTQDEIDTIVNFQYYFSDHVLYRERQMKRFNFIEKLLKEKKVNTILWNVDYFAKSTEFERIAEATNGEIKDYHFSFKGHSDFAKIILKKIEKSILI